MTGSTDNPKRTLSHLKRLIRDGESLIAESPVDERAHAGWIQRSRRYVDRKIPQFGLSSLAAIAPVEFIERPRPAWLKTAITPEEAAARRIAGGIKLMRVMIIFLAQASERLELQIEEEAC